MILGSIAVIALMLAAAVATGLAVADGPLPTHWGLDGTADRFTPKWTALLAMPFAAAIVTLTFSALPLIEPARDGLRRSAGLVRAVWAGVLLVLASAEAATIAAALRRPLDVARLILAALGVCLMLTGNQLGKSRRMYFVGIRTPWTLADEDVWIATHRLAGRLMVLAGLLSAGLALAGAPGSVAGPLLCAALAVAVIVPVVYSWALWRRRA
jgi:uncharacterized membrane protein